MFIFKFVFEIGDSANLTISFSSELLQNDEELIKMLSFFFNSSWNGIKS